MNRYQKAALVWNTEEAEIAKRQYYESPNICLHCGKVIELNGKKPSVVKQKKFCDSSCAAQFNNAGRQRSETSKEKTRHALQSLRVERKCVQCGTVFFTLFNSTNTLCRKCGKHRPIHTKICEECGKNYQTTVKGQRLCSLSCAGKRSVVQQKRRSKNEIYFADLCSQKFDNVLTNENIFNGWDADIIIPDYKIAILWNGNWHHKKLSRKHSLIAVQNRDRIKINEIRKRNYTPFVIDDFGRYNPSFVESKFNEFVEFINNTSRDRVAV